LLLACIVILVGFIAIDKLFNDLKNRIGINLVILAPFTSHHQKINGNTANVEFSMQWLVLISIYL
jgi:hypothetical protein